MVSDGALLTGSRRASPILQTPRMSILDAMPPALGAADPALDTQNICPGNIWGVIKASQ